jgi:hypothetical protein
MFQCVIFIELLSLLCLFVLQLDERNFLVLCIVSGSCGGKEYSLTERLFEEMPMFEGFSRQISILLSLIPELGLVLLYCCMPPLVWIS